MKINCFVFRMKQVQEAQEKEPRSENKVGTKEKEAKKRKVMNILISNLYNLCNIFKLIFF